MASLLSGLIGGGPVLAQAPSAPPVTANVPVWLSDLTLPQSVQITWNAQSNLQSPRYTWRRFTDASQAAVAATDSTFGVSFTDAFAFVPGTTYYYAVTAQGNIVLPASGYAASQSFPVSVDMGNITVTPMQPVPSDDQAVDSRLDPRYAVAHNLDHNFGKTVNGQYVATTYRGGLYTGFISDNSRVGRSFLKFPLAPIPSGQGLWANVGNLYLYYVRSYDTHPTSVQAPPVTDTTWSAPTLNWDSAPAISSSPTAETIAMPPDSTANPAAPWVRWHEYPGLLSGFQSGSSASFGLISQTETSNGWAYFAKKEYNASLAPCLLYGTGGYTVGTPTLSMRLNPPNGIVTQNDGGTGVAYGVVFLSKVAPAGGVTVSLSVTQSGSTPPPAVTLPASVTIPMGQFCTSFTLTYSQTVNSGEHGSYPFNLVASGPGLNTVTTPYAVAY